MYTCPSPDNSMHIPNHDQTIQITAHLLDHHQTIQINVHSLDHHHHTIHISAALPSINTTQISAHLPAHHWFLNEGKVQVLEENWYYSSSCLGPENEIKQFIFPFEESNWSNVSSHFQSSQNTNFWTFKYSGMLSHKYLHLHGQAVQEKVSFLDCQILNMGCDNPLQPQ
jgi:hypothetical protein